MMYFRPYYLVFSILFFAFSGMMKAQSNNLYAEKVLWSDGGGNVLKIFLDNSEIVNGLQFDITLPEGFSIDKNAEIVKNPERMNKMSVNHREYKKNVYRFLAYSFSGDSIRGQQGLVLTIPLNAEDNVGKGTYPVTFSTISMSCVRVVPDTSYRIPDFNTSIEVK